MSFHTGNVAINIGHSLDVNLVAPQANTTKAVKKSQISYGGHPMDA